MNKKNNDKAQREGDKKRQRTTCRQLFRIQICQRTDSDNNESETERDTLRDTTKKKKSRI